MFRRHLSPSAPTRSAAPPKNSPRQRALARAPRQIAYLGCVCGNLYIANGHELNTLFATRHIQAPPSRRRRCHHPAPQIFY